LVNRGINGDTAENLLRRFEDDVAAHDPSHVVIMIGTNDANLKLSLKSYQKDIKHLMDKTEAHGIIPILGLPVPSNDRWLEYRLEKYRFWLMHYIQERSHLMLDFRPAMLFRDGTVNLECYSDDTHPSKTGYSRMSLVFKEYCRNSLAIAGF